MTLNEIKKDAKYWQRLLRLAGYYTGSIDGIKGRLQIAAESRWADDVAIAQVNYGVFDSRTEGNVETLIPEAQAAARKWLAKAIPYAQEQWNLTVKVICGTRSYSEQDALYAQGRTKSGTKVTNARGGYSNHNFGLAFDLGIFNSSKAYLTAGTYYDKIAADVPPASNLIWGGTWTFHDSPHYQLSKFGSSTAKIRAIFTLNSSL